MNELVSRLDRVGHKLGKMKAIEEQNHVLKLDNAYLQKKIARLERDNEDMERKIEELTGFKEDSNGAVFPLHYNGDYDMRLENREMDGQRSEPSKSEPPADAADDRADGKRTTGQPNDSERSAKKSGDDASDRDKQFGETEFKDDDEYQLMTYGFVSKFARKTYVFDPEAESGEEFREKISEKIDSKPPACDKKPAKEEKTGELVAQGSASPVELPSSTVCTENDVARLRKDLEKVIGERNDFKTKYEMYKAKYKKSKRRLTKKSSYCKEIKEERNKLRKTNDDRGRDLKAKLVQANRRIESLENELDKLKDRYGRLDHELDRKDGQVKLQQKEVTKFKEECKRLDFVISQHEKSEVVLRRDVKVLNEKLNRKKGGQDCPNCLKLENECDELNDMYKRTLELLVFETSK